MSVIVITGASSGIGRALALRAARAGYEVVAIGRNRDALESLAERVRAEHGRITTGAFDVADPANARAIVDLARRAFGGINVLVNNAGHVAVGALSSQSDDALRAQFGTHVIGPVALVREALPLLRAVRGHVFMVGSGVARVPVPGLGAYPPSKAATRSAASVLRGELKPDGIAVTYVDPGVVDTAFMTRAGMPGAPATILATPEDVARKILLAVGTRPRVLNAVPWQTAFVALAELFPRLTDLIIEKNPSLVGTQNVSPSSPPQESSLPPPIEPALPAGAQPKRAPSASTPPASAPPERAPSASTPPASAQPERAPSASAPPTSAQPLRTLDDFASSDEGEAALHPGADAADDEQSSPPTFDEALEPVRRRMERVKLREQFVRDLLRGETLLDAHEVALRWAGMPNKNERAATDEVLAALATAGFLERDGARYRVVRGPD